MARTKWLADPAHSEVQFKARHLMLTTVTGYFKKFELEVETEDNDFTKASKILFKAYIDSIDTNNAQRDTHLKSPDFFAAEEYSELRFEGKKFDRHKENYLLHGDLTIRNITKPVTVEVSYEGIVTDPYGQIKAGFTADGKINRKDFNLSWDGIAEAGKVVVSNEIRIHAEIQLIKQKEAPAEKKETMEETHA